VLLLTVDPFSVKELAVFRVSPLAMPPSVAPPTYIRSGQLFQDTA